MKTWYDKVTVLESPMKDSVLGKLLLSFQEQIVADPHNGQVGEDVAEIAVPNGIAGQAHTGPGEAGEHGGQDTKNNERQLEQRK